MLQERIMIDMRESKNLEIKNSLKILTGELQRQREKVVSDEKVIAIIKKLINYEEERLNLSTEKTSIYLETLKMYLPVQTPKEEILKWVETNIDFSKFKNRNQATGVVLKHFGTSTSGDIVKEVLSSMEE